MDADSGIDAGEALGQGQHGRRVVQVKGGHDDGRHPGLGRPGHDGFNILLQGNEVEVAMSVNKGWPLFVRQ